LRISQTTAAKGIPNFATCKMRCAPRTVAASHRPKPEGREIDDEIR
jgi:hypothetical protein